MHFLNLKYFIRLKIYKLFFTVQFQWLSSWINIPIMSHNYPTLLNVCFILLTSAHDHHSEVLVYLEEDLQFLGLCALQDLRLKVFEQGHTKVHLIIRTHHHTAADVVADFGPVQVIPETLSQPVEAHLQINQEKTLHVLGGRFLD